MSLQYVIDGYNIINSSHFIHSRVNKKIKDQRSALLELIKIKGLTGSARNKVILVFDGYAHSGFRLNEASLDIKVIFSEEETADERIMEIIQGAANPSSIVAVSDDNQIRFFARAQKAQVLGVEEFVTRNEKYKKAIDEPLKPELKFSQIQHINEELKKIWLR